MEGASATTGQGRSGAAEDRLESWKAIAVYLARDERTVRRWERQEGLPVRRHVHQRKASVYAFKSELDAWRQTRSAVLNAKPKTDWGRVAAGGVLWFIAYNVLTALVWQLVLRYVGLASFHRLLSEPSGLDLTRALRILPLTLAMGLTGVWLYAAMEPRYGSGLRTVLYAALAQWWFWGLMPLIPDILAGSLPLGPFAMELASKLAVITLATWVGAWVYRAQASMWSRAPASKSNNAS